jgi:hypothetical protein
MRKIALFFMFLLLTSSLVTALTISPTELRIKNLDEDKDYKFIVLITNEEEGFVEVELKTSDDSVATSPNKFMLNGGEKRSVRLVLNARKLDKEKRKILLQPYINEIPSANKLSIYLESNSTLTPDIEEKKTFEMMVQQPEFISIVIYILIAIVLGLVILIFIPEIKKSAKKAKEKQANLQDRNFYNRTSTRTSKMLQRLEKADAAILDIIDKVDKFHTDADTWLKEKSNGKYGL